MMKSEKEDLLGVLIRAGISSRRKLAEAIMQGRVTVNGETVTNLRHPINIGEDTIFINGKRIGLRPKQYVYIILNKPEGVLSTVGDSRGRKTVSDYVPEKYRHLKLYPAGRLDKDTTGLILLTNDGDLTYRLTHPSFENEKEYLVSIRGELRPEEIKRLEKGIELEEGKTAPAVVKEIYAPPFNYSLTIHEGRKRQVKRMFAALGHRVLALKRVRIGRLTLGDLKEGEVREMGGEEIRR